MRRFSKKNEHEKEDEEAERNVRKSPKKKPPRTDKTRRRVKKEDPDVDGDPDTEDDDDLSMNYKDIGGSLIENVTRRFLFADDKKEQKDDEDEKEEDDKPSGFPGQNKKEDPDEDKKDEEEKPEDKEKSDLEKTKKKEEKLDEEGIEQRAKDLYEEGVPELVTEDNKKVRQKAVEMMKKVLPPDWDPDEAFEAGVLTLDARKQLRKHISNWDRKTMEDNLTALKKSQLDVFLENPTDKQEHYHQALLDLFLEEKKDLVDQNIKPPESLDGFVSEDLEGGLDKKTEKAIQKALPVWWDYLRVMNSKQTKDIKNQIDTVMDDLDSLSARYAALAVLKNLVRGALEMKNNNKSKEARRLVSSIKKGFQREKKARYGGLPGPLDMADGYKPPVTHWKKPDPRDLRMKDYISIIKTAIDWYNDDYLKHDLVEHNRKAACLAALDYSIWDTKNGLYDATIDAPTYNKLLEALLSITNEQ